MNIYLLQQNSIANIGLSHLLETQGYKVNFKFTQNKRTNTKTSNLLIINLEHFTTIARPTKLECCGIILLGKLYHLHCIESFKSNSIGFVSKKSKPIALLNALKDIKEGSSFCLDNTIKEILRKSRLEKQNYLLEESLKEPFTKTELKILEEVAKGRTTEQIAESSYRSVYTIQNHRKNIKQKFKEESLLPLTSFSILHKNSIATLNYIEENDLVKI